MKKDSDEFVDKVLGKKNSKYLNDCVRILELFDPSDPDPKIIPGFPLTDFLYELTCWDKFIKIIAEEKDGDVREFLEFRLSNIVFQAGIGVGFVLGNLFDLPHPEFQKNFKAIKKVLIERKVIPYIPREKKAA